MTQHTQNTQNTQTEKNTHDRLLEEVRRERGGKPAPKGFQTLPDGTYEGVVFIGIKTIQSEQSPNFGRDKYEIELTVTDGEFKGKTAYHNRVIFPYNLANEPSADSAEHKQWRTAAKDWLEKSDEILARCGVDTHDTDKELFTKKIAENNRRRPKVNFTMKNGYSYINYVVREDDTRELFDGTNIPDGNDAPLN